MPARKKYELDFCYRLRRCGPSEKRSRSSDRAGRFVLKESRRPYDRSSGRVQPSDPGSRSCVWARHPVCNSSLARACSAEAAARTSAPHNSRTSRTTSFESRSTSTIRTCSPSSPSSPPMSLSRSPSDAGAPPPQPCAAETSRIHLAASQWQVLRLAQYRLPITFEVPFSTSIELKCTFMVLSSLDRLHV
jgi:hypothetical protein